MEGHEGENLKNMLKELLQKRLEWCTFCTSGEDLDTDEVQAILSLLEIYDPIYIASDKPQREYEKFKKMVFRREQTPE